MLSSLPSIALLVSALLTGAVANPVTVAPRAATTSEPNCSGGTTLSNGVVTLATCKTLDVPSAPSVKSSTKTSIKSSTKTSSATVSGVATAICKPSSCGRNGSGLACPSPSKSSASATKTSKASAAKTSKATRDVSAEIVKRAAGDLPSPSDYNNNMDTFMTTLFGKSSTEKVSLPNEIISSSNTLAWSASSDNGLALGVEGLFGCGSIVIASRKGIWMSHHWQEGFYSDDSVQKQVVTPLGDGNDAMDPKLPTTIANVFTKDDNVNVLLLTPEAIQFVPPDEDNPQAYKDIFNYQDKMEGAVKDKLKNLLPSNAQFKTPIRYAIPQNTDQGKTILEDNKDAEMGPEASQEWQDFVNNHALGHVLTVYSPTGVSDKPAYKIYLGDSTTPVLEDNWSS